VTSASTAPLEQPQKGEPSGSPNTVANIGYRGIARFITFGLQAATSVVLARYLSARDYGIFGYASIFVAFLARFNDLGLGQAIVQRQELEDRVINIAFTVRLALGTAAFGLAVAASKFVGYSFGDPAVSTVVIVLSLDFLISSFSFIPNFLMVRELDFRRWIQPMIAAAVVRTALACWLAIKGYGFWSIVLASVASSVISTIWFLLLKRVRVRFAWDKRIAHELMRFGVPLFSAGLLVFALFNADNFMIGTFAGAVALGYYAIAFNWGSMSAGLVYEVVHTVLFPTLARIQDNPAQLRRMYLRVMEQLSMVGVLVHVGLFCCAKEFLVIVLGHGTEKWAMATRPLQILCVYGLVRLMLEPLGNVLLALGRTRLMFRANLIAAICELSLLYPAVRYGGLNAVAVVVTVAYAIQWFVYWPVIRFSLDIRISEIVRVFLPSLLGGISGLIIGICIQSVSPMGPTRLVLMILGITLVFSIVHGITSSWQWLSEWKQLYAARMQRTLP
jgi:lipopolysaccharide exporter